MVGISRKGELGFVTYWKISGFLSEEQQPQFLKDLASERLWRGSDTFFAQGGCDIPEATHFGSAFWPSLLLGVKTLGLDPE